jgi:tryptophan synthase alpha chain
VKTTVELITILTEEGVSAIELGVPFSDPVADGPVIQQIAEKALESGVTLRDVFAIARAVRAQGNDVPLILFSYYNPLLSYGLEQTAIDAKAAGFSGFIVPDLPYEESGPLSDALTRVRIPLVPLVAPTSEERVAKIVEHAEGFIYCISSLGPTGMGQEFAKNVVSFLKQVRTHSPVPIAVGFGISNSEQVKRFKGVADGVIVGSALVKLIADCEVALSTSTERAQALLTIRRFVRELLSD